MVGAAGQSVLRALVAAATLGVAVPVGAAEPRTFTLAYSAPEGCPARSTFVASIRARAESRELEQLGELAFEVALEPVGELTRGRLTVRFSGGERFEREVPAARCPDVTTTMAIMAGLLLSGSLLPDPAPTPEPEPEPQPEPALAPAPPPPPPQLSPTPPPPVAPSSPAPFGRFRLGAAAHAELDLGALPFPALGASVGLDAAVERASWFSPSLRAGFTYLTAQESHPPEGDALFTLRALFVRACPLRLELRLPLAVTACALLDAGALEVAGRSTTLPEDVSMTWAAIGSAVRLSARLTPVLTLEAEARLHGLVRHDRFVLQPGAVQIHEIPIVSGGFGLGLLAQLP